MRLGVVAVLAGCSFTPGSVGRDGAGVDDASDGESEDAAACLSFATTHFDACAIPMPTDDIHLVEADSPYTYTTGTDGGVLTTAGGAAVPITSVDYEQAGGVHAALWTMNDLVIDPNVELYAAGAKPLIIAAWGTVTHAGVIDAGSHVGVRIGAGANPASCSTHRAMDGADGDSGNGGGGGGGNRGNGGNGGNGDANCGTAPCQKAGGMRGTAVSAPTIVEGGCNGGTSGSALDSNATRAGSGRGGGAVLIAARGALAITGSVLAGGGGGRGDPNGQVSTGGGGGGAGGFIGLEAPAIDITGATFAANGGGGGGGGDIGSSGDNGDDGGATAAAAGGGGAGGSATSGGVGSSMTQLDGQAPTGSVQNGGGGGGGGGAGFILYWTASLSGAPALASPPAVAGP